MLPGTWVQIAVTLGAVVPGFVYQVSRRRVAGPGPDEADVSVRVLRSIAASAVFAGLYAVAFGPTIASYLTHPQYVSENPRTIGTYCLLLIVAVPWLAARAGFYVSTSATYGRLGAQARSKLHLNRQWDPTPSAWDFAFSKRAPGWVRVRTADGLWVGGWFGNDSFASSFPDPQDLYLEIGYAMTDDGRFTTAVSAPDGVFVRCSEIALVDFIADQPETETENDVEGA